MMSVARAGVAALLVGTLLALQGSVPATSAAEFAAQEGPPELTPQDASVYQAVLAHTIRPELERLTRGSLPSNPPVLVANRTTALCEPPPAKPARQGCLGDSVFDPLEGGPRIRELAFADSLDDITRAALIVALRERNRVTAQFPAGRLRGVVAVQSDQLEAARKRYEGRTLGYAAFSVPAYSEDGQALVYATYFCGALCGKGWLFLLQQVDGAWTVHSARMLWIS